MTVRVRLFAAAAEAYGGREWVAELEPGATVAGVLESLASASPRLAELLPRCLVAVDRTYAGSETTLHDGAELAIIPPVSGGTSDSEAPFCRVSPEPINVAALLERVSHGGAGGVVIFLGNVRGRTGTVSTERLEYEAYPEMAESKLSEIMASATDRWPGVRLAVAHRVGVLGPGETSVVVAASAPHRDAAFEAARFTIDQLKTIVPIWKKEVLADGRSFWVDHA